MAIEIYGYRVEGVSSLLMHNAQAMEQEPAANSPGPKKIPAPEEEAERGAYRDEEGALYLPSNAFRSSILSGAKGRRIGKVSAKTIIAGAVFNTEPRTKLFDPVTKEPIRSYRVHRARVVVQRGSAILRSRPEIERWECMLWLEVDTEFVSPEVVEELLNVAGRIAGVGDWRPERTGPHGRYRATLVGEARDEDRVADAESP